jgi:hypothetical protein
VVGRAHGIAGSLSLRPRAMHRHYAWPSARWAAPDGTALPTYAAMEAFGIDDILDPRDTRTLLREFIESAQSWIATQLGPATGRFAYRV